MRKSTVIGVVLIALGIGLIMMTGVGIFGDLEPAGEANTHSLPEAVVKQRGELQKASAALLNANTSKQILFGDFHVHTTFSYDAFMQNVPLFGGTGAHPPADACDFARYCSQLDFWSINDHAEELTPYHWGEIVKSVKQCDAVAGQSDEPDLVTFLGWEWSQMGSTPKNHYGHKNVVIKDLQERNIPNRPIAAKRPVAGVPKPRQWQLALLAAKEQDSRYLDWARYVRETEAVEPCPADLPPHGERADCREYTSTPDQLYDKLDAWDIDAIVIPHGTVWGIYTPPGTDWSKQLQTTDPTRETLIEVYSGHGNAEEYFNNGAIAWTQDGEAYCPQPSADFVPGCYRAGEIIYQRCISAGLDETDCRKRKLKAQNDYLGGSSGGHLSILDASPDDWLDANQCSTCFQPAFNYRPGSSVQAILASRSQDENGEEKRFTMGFIASSDNHQGRPGTGYKEFAMGEMTEGRKSSAADLVNPYGTLKTQGDEPLLESRPVSVATFASAGVKAFETERVGSFFYTGGLMAVHSEGRSRQAIWDAIERKEVYGTSGPRILLWFEQLDDDSGEVAASMGAIRSEGDNPLFRVRALGSLKQKPGCPDFATTAMGDARINSVCMGECYNPSDERRQISRIEVVRIHPQNSPQEPLADLIEDPWLVLPCPQDAEGCTVEFKDEAFEHAARDALYYVRAIEEPSLAVNGGGQQCTRDETGRCIAIVDCGQRGDQGDDCLAMSEQRAWSSPIYINFEDND